MNLRHVWRLRNTMAWEFTHTGLSGLSVTICWSSRPSAESIRFSWVTAIALHRLFQSFLCWELIETRLQGRQTASLYRVANAQSRIGVYYDYSYIRFYS